MESPTDTVRTTVCTLFMVARRLGNVGNVVGRGARGSSRGEHLVRAIVPHRSPLGGVGNIGEGEGDPFGRAVLRETVGEISRVRPLLPTGRSLRVGAIDLNSALDVRAANAGEVVVTGSIPDLDGARGEGGLHGVRI